MTEEVEETSEATTRKLASVQKIVDIKPIKGADFIVMAQVLGWQCVVNKKENLKVGDLVVYFEVDSILPQEEKFEFLRERKFRIKTMKFKGQISEGLIMPLTILPLRSEQFCGGMLVTWNPKDEKQSGIPIEEGLDVTDIIGVVKHDPEGKKEQALVEKTKRSPLMRFLMDIPAFRWAYLKLNSNVKGNWPPWIARTDETRIQVCAKLLMEHYNEEWEVTEKLDGQSATFFLHPLKFWGRMVNKFGVCSRKIWLKTPTNSKYWESARQYNIEKVLKRVGKDMYIQGEQCGPGIQKNKYKLSSQRLYLFNLDVEGVRYNYEGLFTFCNANGLECVPLVKETFVPEIEIGKDKTIMEVVQFLIAMSQGNSDLLARPREGIVVRLKSNPQISFKVINPFFKMEQEADEDDEDGEENEN